MCVWAYVRVCVGVCKVVRVCNVLYEGSDTVIFSVQDFKISRFRKDFDNKKTIKRQLNKLKVTLYSHSLSQLTAIYLKYCVCTALGPDCVYVLHWDLVMTVCTALGPSYDCMYVLHWDLTVCMYCTGT